MTQDSDISGTCLQGYLLATPAELIREFGAPCDLFEKSSAAWFLRVGDTIITIYDSVDEGFENVTRKSDAPYRWHIGGVKPSVIGILAALLGKNMSQGDDKYTVVGAK